MAPRIPESVHYRDEPMGLHKHYLQSCFVDSTLVYQRVITLIHSAIDHIFKKIFCCSHASHMLCQLLAGSVTA